MADRQWNGSPLKGVNNNLSNSMPKRKLSELYLEEKKYPRKRKLQDSEGKPPSKKPRLYPQFEALAARLKGYLERRRVAGMVFLFYWL